MSIFVTKHLYNAKSIFHPVLNIFNITRNEPAIGKANWIYFCYIENLTMAECSYCNGDLVLLYFSRATPSTCIILGDTCEFDRVNSPLKYSEINSAVCHIRCCILFRLRTVVPPISEYGKIYMGILCGFCCWLWIFILVSYFILYACLWNAYQLCRWLTTFIFAAQDYNLNNCKLASPVGVSCAVKKANEAFMFITL